MTWNFITGHSLDPRKKMSKLSVVNEKVIKVWSGFNISFKSSLHFQSLDISNFFILWLVAAAVGTVYYFFTTGLLTAVIILILKLMLT